MLMQIASALIIFSLISAQAWANCTQQCTDTYEECKASQNSPNGEKVCGSDYHRCSQECAEQ
jgi:hypothetical protein